ncbi:MAG: CocE/NonD family hydrolase [Pseudomonadota bacterium]
MGTGAMANIEETRWIALPDGTRLAARIWWPEAETAGDGPYPAVLEYLPYRRRDGTAERDEATYPAFAAAGIVGIRVDSRGQGDSEGFFDDEYSPQELADCCDVIAWIAAQDWSNGAVGMMGISWGGFNGLQVAAMRPPALKAVISIASSADRYADDIHFKGGCLLGAKIAWAGTMLSYTSRPPDPESAGPGWREIWRRRLEAMPAILDTWLSRQRRDEYWRHGSICEDWGAIQCPVFAISGWADGYRNTPAALARHLKAPVKAMTGPWVHLYPHFAAPEPRADFLSMAIDWWRQWLVGEARGVETWPAYRAWLAESPRPDGDRSVEAGRWVGTDWPSKRVENVVLMLGADGRFGSAKGPRRIASPESCGIMGGAFFTQSTQSDQPGDQRRDDALSTCWEGEVLTEPLDLLGRAELHLTATPDRSHGHLIARLVDLHPDGAARLIALGTLNLAQRGGHATPEPMMPGEPVAIHMKLDEMGYRLLPGHWLRLALSTAYWPMIQPAPAPLSLLVEDVRLVLPRLTGAVEAPPPAPNGPAPLPSFPRETPASAGRRAVLDLDSGATTYIRESDTGRVVHPGHGMIKNETARETWRIDPGNPAGASGHLVFTTLRERGAWKAETQVEIRFTAHAESYRAEIDLSAETGGETFATRRWSLSIPRDLG